MFLQHTPVEGKILQNGYQASVYEGFYQKDECSKDAFFQGWMCENLLKDRIQIEGIWRKIKGAGIEEKIRYNKQHWLQLH